MDIKLSTFWYGVGFLCGLNTLWTMYVTYRSSKAEQVRAKRRALSSTISCRRYCGNKCLCNTLEDCEYEDKNILPLTKKVLILTNIIVVGIGLYLLILYMLGKW